jgi:hypothetical protein
MFKYFTIKQKLTFLLFLYALAFMKIYQDGGLKRMIKESGKNIWSN